MRFTTGLPILALAISLVPLSGADAPSGLALDAPSQANVGVAIPINFTLTITNFACAADFPVTVALDASASDGAMLSPSLDATNVTLTIPAGSYLIGAWTGHGNVTLSTSGDAASAAGDVTVHALFAPTDEGPCVTGGGFAPSEASATIHVAGAPPAPPASGGTTTPPTPSVNDTQTPPPTNGTTNQTAPPPSNGTTANGTAGGSANGTTNGTVDQLPPGGGYIGDYQPTESRGVPAPALWGTLVAVGIAAFAATRRFRS